MWWWTKKYLIEVIRNSKRKIRFQILRHTSRGVLTRRVLTRRPAKKLETEFKKVGVSSTNSFFDFDYMFNNKV